MPKFLSIKLDRSQLLGLLLLLGIAVIFIGIAMAITAFNPQNQPVGYVAQDEMSNYNLTSGTETLYRPEYERENWSGNLYAYPANASGGLDFANERWTGSGGKGAKWHIDAQNYSTGRFIATMKDNGAAIPFLSASMSTAQQTSLAATIQGTAYTSNQIVNFLRGDRSNEGSTALRQRSSVLGDIIHSRPYYVNDGTNPTIFVGANDGMLHAINATNTASGGSERWAYVPSMLIPKLDTLAANPYTHDYFVDGQINIANIVVSSTPKRILVGGLGSGGKGLYGLDITSLTATSDATAASKVLWEITPTTISYAPSTSAAASSAYSNLGYTYGTPTIGQTQDNNYSVIAGNGYNDAGNYQAYLYIINAANGQLIKAIQAGSSGTAASPNGLSTPAAIDSNNDGKIDYVYAGDLNGNMWKFDISNASAGSWPSTATLLYTTSPAQPITTTPGVAAHPNGGYMVTFGTGQMLNYTFPSATRTNSTDPAPAGTDPDKDTVYYVYGIWDGAPAANSTLITQTLTERSYTDNSGVARRVRRSTANTPSWASGGNKGWKVALPAGERVVGEGSFIESGRYYFNSYNPNISLAVPNTTTNVYGENWLNELNYLTGGSSALPFLDLNADLLLNDSDRIRYVTTDTRPAGKAVGDPILSPNENGIPVSKWLSNGVQSQPILVTLRTLNTTLFNQNPDVSFPAIAAGVRGVAGGHFDVDSFYGTNMNCDNVVGAGSQATGSVTFTYSGSKSPSNITITVGSTTLVNLNNPGTNNASNLARAVSNNNVSSAYTLTRSGSTVNITANNVGATYNGTIAVTYTGATGLTYSTVNLSGGNDALPAPYSGSSTSCNNVIHEHEYDDLFDRTGVDFLNASLPSLDLSNAIPSNATNFKVLMMNQYLSPSLSLNIGNASYNETSGAGYISVRNYQTAYNNLAGDNLDITTVPTYNRSTIGSLVINMPIDAFEIKNWWGNGDNRVGLHPTQPACVINGPVTAFGGTGTGASADLYNPVVPPANGTNGAGTLGTTTGVRHNGALNIEIIKSNTPQSAIEANVAGRPEYGFRVKQAYYYTYVLAEYAIYWHHPNRVCYNDSTTTWYKAPNAGSHIGESGGNGFSSAAYGAWNTAALMVGTGWSKTPPQDITGLAPGDALDASAGTDPHLGTFGATGALASTTVSISGNTTTTTYNYIDGTKIVIARTTNNNGTVTIQTTNYNNDGTVASTSTSIVADNSGSVKTGGDERGLQARTGRISWHELIRN